jgi:hypothetical protein
MLFLSLIAKKSFFVSLAENKYYCSVGQKLNLCN